MRFNLIKYNVLLEFKLKFSYNYDGDKNVIYMFNFK